MATWQFNRGEWTEAYVFLRLLSDGRIYGASADLTKDSSIFIDILNIIRDEPDKIVIFERFIKDNIAHINSSRDGNVIKVVTAPEISIYAKELYNQIKGIASNRVIEAKTIQNYLEALGIDSPKANLSNAAKEKYGAKTDIIITSKNPLDHTISTEGFSIKSHIGSPATLFNCSQTSGFVFKIIGCDEDGMHHLNSMESFLSIMEGLKDNYTLKYIGCRNDIFEQNISIVDSRMEEILSTAVLVQANYFETCTSNDVKIICDIVSKINPIKVKNPQLFYTAKFKDFLFDAFAGMTASSTWNGRKRLTGGYIDVNKEGEMLYYRAISDDIFGNYLFENTYFDRPDRGVCKDIAIAEANAYLNGRKLSIPELNSLTFKDGSTNQKKAKKGDFGYVYKKEDEYFIDLNFQIRFR